MKRLLVFGLVLVWTMGLPGGSQGHFGMLIPSESMLMQEGPQSGVLVLSFSHPFEGVGMELLSPKSFRVYSPIGEEDLSALLKPAKVMGSGGWRIRYQYKRPGAYVFCMEPQPYWEPAEDLFIIHYTKTVVGALGLDEGWDREVGLKTEIVPLTRPFGLYAGNVFQGVVKVDGKPAPYAEVEVEFYNRQGKYQAPSDYMVTQVIKADGNGVFTYAAPKSGWWGFSALTEADFTIPKDGEPKQVEIGAVIWVEFIDWQTR